MEEFIKNFADVFDDTDASEIQADTEFQDLDEWGSLMAMSVIAMARTKYNKAITGKDIHSCETVADLYNLIAGK